MPPAKNDSIEYVGQRFEVFRGREGKNNERILDLLSKENLSQYKISTRLGKKYNTILDRLRALQTQGIVKEVGKVKAEKTRSEISLYGLAPRGLQIAVFNSPNRSTQSNALDRCSRLFRDAWTLFCVLYDIKGKESQSFMRWISSDEGVRGMLGYHSYRILENDAQALLGIRRMIDIAVSLEQSSLISELIESAYYGNVTVVGAEPARHEEKASDIKTLEEALKTLAKIAARHPILRKLSNAVKEADAPLLTRIEHDMKERQQKLGTWTISATITNVPVGPFKVTAKVL